MYSETLQNKILNYYEDYYKSCGLKDFKERATERLKEESLEKERMKSLQQKVGVLHGKHFIFGAGTAGLAVVLKQEYGIEVYGIEPSSVEFDIIQMKLKEKGMDVTHFKKEYGENMSFSDNMFDFCHCFTVLEHVTDVKKCLLEMVRITKKGGIIYINTPNYASFEERHYKIRFLFPPAYMPRFLSYFYLILRGRPVKFLRSINFLTKRKLDKILKEIDNISFKRIGTKKNQEILITKL